MKRLGLICLVMCFSHYADAQLRMVSKEKLENAQGHKLSVNALSLRFETNHISAEPMSEDSGIHTYMFPFENVGKDTLVITKLVTTCSCASASYEKQTVLPGERSEIVVRYNPKGHPGRFERKVFVYTGDEESPSATLRLSVEVERGADQSGLYPISMGNIRLRRNEIILNKGVPAVEKCVFLNVGDKALKLVCEEVMLPDCLTFRTEPETVMVGEEGIIVIEYDPVMGGERLRIPVIMKGLGIPPSQSAINVIINENKDN